ARSGGVLARVGGGDRAPAPALRADGGGLRRVRVDGPRRAPALATLGADLPAPLRGGRCPAPHPFPRFPEPEGRVPARDQPRAPRPARPGNRLGALARAPPP